MNGRDKKIKRWMEEIYGDIIKQYDVFANNLISENDIGGIAMKTILRSYEQLIDVIIFILDEDNTNEREKEVDSE